MNNFTFITPTEFKHKHPDSPRSLEELQALASKPDQTCENCDELAWKFVDISLCFSCTTGEADASNDYELIPD